MAADALVIDRAPVEEALTWPERAKAVVIRDAPTYSAAAELLKGIKALRARIAETFGPHIKRADAAHKALVAEAAAANAPLIEAERAIKDRLVAYDLEQDRLRRIEEARLAEEARKAEEARRLEEAAALEREAAFTGDADLQAEAEQVIAEAIAAPAPVVSIASSTPKVAGVSFRETWSAEVDSLPALIRHVAAHPELINLLIANMPALNGQARSLKGALAIPGVRAVCKRDVAAGRT